MTINKKPIVALYFKSLTPPFDFFTTISGYGGRLHQQTVNLLELKPGEQLLDIGCGTASFLLIAKLQCPLIEATGIDLDPSILAIAQRKVAMKKQEVSLVQSSADKLPFMDNSFVVPDSGDRAKQPLRRL